MAESFYENEEDRRLALLEDQERRLRRTRGLAGLAAQAVFRGMNRPEMDALRENQETRKSTIDRAKLLGARAQLLRSYLDLTGGVENGVAKNPSRAQRKADGSADWSELDFQAEVRAGVGIAKGFGPEFGEGPQPALAPQKPKPKPTMGFFPLSSITQSRDPNPEAGIMGPMNTLARKRFLGR